ncbi:MAG: GWxTD domain-containing protein [Candidatus Koribacter versatilis]|uniref:GWxTD domain-containing protein n=1 Tax=Candidatus Korobacter versatilis TaxID=658062 RepID=A0A932A7G7_9BACT|nr:GWxTD domain-containing protein [Candidatus Koribacter versatilis]
MSCIQSRPFAALLVAIFLSFSGGVLRAQDTKPGEPAAKAAPPQTADPKAGAAASGEQDPLKRPLSEKQKKENEKSLKQELSKTYQRWLKEDVTYIITGEELAAFKQLSNDEERDQFIEQFWLRRDPTPDTVENEYKEEHYRRIAYANEHYASGKQGWRTDRGRIYIVFGPPDEVDSHPSGGYYQRPMSEGGGSTSTYPFEIWRYRYLENIGQEIEIEFVDKSVSGEYRMTLDRSEKDALLNTPNGGLTQYEQMGLSGKADRFNRGQIERLGRNPFENVDNSKFFDRMDTFYKLQKTPPVKFKGLEEIVSHKIRYNLMPFDVRTDFVRVTSDTVLVPVTIQVKNKDITFAAKDGIQRGVVNIFGRISTMTGRIAQTFEDTVQIDVPNDLLTKTQENASLYWKAVPLRPGRYRLDVVVKDVNGDRLGTWNRGIQVPAFDEDKLAYSSLILADQMEKVSSKTIGSGNFVIGTTKVRPRLDAANGKPATFKRNQRVNFWMQVYNLGIDEKTNKPEATVEYDVVNTATNKAVLHTAESTAQMGNIGAQMTLEKTFTLDKLEPGTYLITIKVDDKISKQTVSPTAKFSVE